MKIKKILATLTLGIVVCTHAIADEGMWMLTDIKHQNEMAMKELGLMIPVDMIYSTEGISIKDAVVHFGGGCTGEIISSEGLVLTNHHCGYSAIARHSTVEHDYLTHGFWAMNHEEELATPGLNVTFIDKILDVTSYVKEQLQKDEDPNGTNYLSPKYLTQVAKRFIESEKITLGKGQITELKPFYGGNRYYMFIKTVYPDVRMVGAPPSSIGKFGADTDNWMWPRHTGDFSLFRIYADKNGEPAEYSKDNVPLRPKKHVKISLAGYKESDFTFIMGFPGRNWRYMISDEVEERMETINFMRHHIRDARQQALMEEMVKDDAVRIHYASRYASSANYWKNAIGMNEGLKRLHVLDTKKAQQEAILQYAKEKNDRKIEEAFQTIRKVVADRKPSMYHYYAISEALYAPIQLCSAPSTKKLEQALKSKQKAAIKAQTDSLTLDAEKYFQRMPFPEVERKVSKALLKAYKEYVPEADRISVFANIAREYGDDTDAYVDSWFEKSIFGSKENYDRFAQKPSLKQLQNDPLITYVNSVVEGMQACANTMAEANKNYDAAHKEWVRGTLEKKNAEGRPIYPDANSTLRLTYGSVRSYSPADGVTYDYQTTLKGVMQKEDPTNSEFIVPDKLKELYTHKDYGRYADENGEMPVCFIVNTDNTGGNSGSPCFNAKGELIGTGFDRNYEGLTGDIAFRPSSQRAIVVDIRYTLFIIDKFAGASHLIKELDIAD